MADEIDIETARLDYLNAQKQKRISEILHENEGLFWVKPKVGDEEHPREYAEAVMPDGRAIEAKKKPKPK